MRRIVIIGNGFDLAHGLKTSYSDFILWYLNGVIDSTCENEKYDDGVTTCYLENGEWSDQTLKKLKGCQSVKDFIFYLSNSEFKIGYKSNFMKDIVEIIGTPRWVDIESTYYRYITKFFRAYKQNTNNDQANSGILSTLNLFNSHFELVRLKLENYLSEQISKIDHIVVDENLNDIFFGEIKSRDIQKRFDHRVGAARLVPHKVDSVYFVNFNYTNLIGRYAREFRPNENLDIKHIHGQINDKSNPIIFGYGDHFDGYYSEIEDTNENEFLKQMKYFNYLSSRYYHEIMNFVEVDKFQVVVLGHSLGVSDRTMLKRIFEDKNCVSIKVFCYEFENGKTDFQEKMMELSRHFSDKAVMLEKCVCYSPELIFKVKQQK